MAVNLFCTSVIILKAIMCIDEDYGYQKFIVVVYYLIISYTDYKVN